MKYSLGAPWKKGSDKNVKRWYLWGLTNFKINHIRTDMHKKYCFLQGDIVGEGPLILYSDILF